MKTCEKCGGVNAGETIVAGFLPINLCSLCYRCWCCEYLGSEALVRLCLINHNQQDRRDLGEKEMQDRQILMLKIVCDTSAWLVRKE